MGKKKQEFVLIEILLEWQDAATQSGAFGVELRFPERTKRPPSVCRSARCIRLGR